MEREWGLGGKREWGLGATELRFGGCLRDFNLRQAPFRNWRRPHGGVAPTPDDRGWEWLGTQGWQDQDIPRASAMYVWGLLIAK